ncbi:hypothetical protein HKD37_15G043352 [Glycine soja]
MSHHSSSVNGEGTSHKDPLSRILDELRSLKLWKEKIERKEKGKETLRKEKHVSYSSHDPCKSLSEELCDYYERRHNSYLRPHSHRRKKERKPQEANINLSYFHGKDNVEAYLDRKIRVEQQLKKKSTSKSYCPHSYPKKDQGQSILGTTPSKPKDDKRKTIENMQEKTTSIKCFKYLGRGHITSQCPTKKTMIMRGQEIYSSQDEATTSPSSSEKGQPLMVKEECKEVSVYSKRLAKKESGMMNVLSSVTLFCKITHASNTFMIHIHRDSLEANDSIDEEDPRPTSSTWSYIIEGSSSATRKNICPSKSGEKKGMISSMKEVSDSLKDFVEVTKKKMEKKKDVKIKEAQEVVHEVVNELDNIPNFNCALRHRAIDWLTQKISLSLRL